MFDELKEVKFFQEIQISGVCKTLCLKKPKF